MLNDRQKNIILELENTLSPVTAKELAKKYSVSLRTIRNDIALITEFTQLHQAKIVKVPHVGMRIESPFSLSLYFDNQYINENFYYLDTQNRYILILMNFIMRENPITIQELEQAFKVSRSTIQSVLKDLSSYLNTWNIHLEGKKKKGYVLICQISDLIPLLDAFISQNGNKVLSDILFDQRNGFIPEDEKQKIEGLIQFMSDQLYLFVTDYHKLIVFLGVLIRWMKRKTKQEFIYVNGNIKLEHIIHKMEDLFQIDFSEEAISILLLSLQSCTDYLDSDNNYQNLDFEVQKLINQVKEKGYLINDEDTLRIDLVKHLKCTLENKRLGYSNKNPLLKNIQELYTSEFKLVQTCIKELPSFCVSEKDLDEIGYLTLYIKRSFEKAQTIEESRVMVVCNSGRSASKLLSTRLLNNLPNLHIVSISSLFELQSNTEFLEHVDFIISTVPLPGIKKPYVVVSPFLQKQEINQVKELIWLHSTGKHKVIRQEKDEILLQQDRISFTSSFVQEALKQGAVGEYYADIVVEVFELLQKIYPNGIYRENYNNVAGIFAHVLMSVSRWKKQEFIRAADFEDMVYQNQQAYQCILAFLQKISKKLEVLIPDIEAIAILRYYIF